MKAVNLIPAEERSASGIDAGRAGGTVYVVFALLGGLALLTLLYGLAAHQISNRKSEAAALTARTRQAQAQAAALTPYTSFAAMRQQRQQAVETLIDARFDWAQAFRELGRVLPANVALISLTGTIGSSNGSSSASASAKSSATVTSATPPGSVPAFTIFGCATSQSEVAVMLDRLRLIDGVSEVALQSSATSESPGGGGKSSGGGHSGSAAESCTNGQPAFNVNITFDALPTLPATGRVATTTVAAAASGASTGATP